MGDTASRVTLRQLEIFLAVAREGTTLEAGHALALSQSAVRASLKALQSNHGTVLFDRVGNRLALNHAGRRLESRARQLLDEARKLEAELLAAAPSGDLNISASFTIANHLLVDYLTPWLNRYPSARVDITPGNTPDVVERVLNRDSELGLIENEMTVPGVDLIPWVQDELFAFCSPPTRWLPGVEFGKPIFCRSTGYSGSPNPVPDPCSMRCLSPSCRRCPFGWNYGTTSPFCGPWNSSWVSVVCQRRYWPPT